ncbi:MAG: hypothetical protein WC720_05150 [Candidatus Shapirobacteria bacterium]|jgi:hypothetical protein
MKTYKITKKRDGQESKVVHEIYTSNWQAARKEFRSMMLSNCDYEDESCFEGFQNNQKTIFRDDVYTYQLHSSTWSK